MPKKEVSVKVGVSIPELGKGWKSSGFAIVNDEGSSYIELVANNGQLMDWQLDKNEILAMAAPSPVEQGE